jgi:hypothetical protein
MMEQDEMPIFEKNRATQGLKKKNEKRYATTLRKSYYLTLF